MWKSTAGHSIISNSNPMSKKMSLENNNDPDDWDTDPDFIVSLFNDLNKTNSIINNINIF